MSDQIVRPLTHAERCARFGKFKFTPAPKPDNPERIIVDPAWTAAHIVTVQLPQLGRRVQIHRDVADEFLGLFQSWEDAGLDHLVVTFNGGWVARYKRGHAGGDDHDLSNHSWGTAFDINAQWNGLGNTPASVGEQGSVRPLVAIANARGWAWGGHWAKPDGMHFEWTGGARG